MRVTAFLTILYRVEATVTAIAYLAATVSLLADVVGREFLQQGVWGAPRFSVYAAIIAGFLGMSLAASDDSQIRPQIFDALIAAKFDPFFNRLADFISALMYGGLTILAGQFVASSYQNLDVAPVLEWPLWPIQLVLPYAFASVMVRYGCYFIFPDCKAAFLRNLTAGRNVNGNAV